MPRRTRTTRLTRLTAVTLTAVLLIWGGTALAVVAPTPVLHKKVDEVSGAASPGWFSWAENSATHPRHFDTYILADGGTAKKVNASDTIGWGGGLDGTTLVFQQVGGAAKDSKIKLYDAITKDRSDPIASVNSKWWDWGPTISGDWIFSARNSINQSNSPKQWLLLTNQQTGEQRKFVAEGQRFKLFPGQVAGDFVAYADCIKGCKAILYQISTQESTSLAPDAGAELFGSAVTADGTAYVLKDYEGDCVGAEIIRVGLGQPGQTIALIPAGRDISFMFAEDTGTGTNLYFDYYQCSKGAPTDIYAIYDADSVSAPLALPVTEGDGGSGPMIEGPAVRSSASMRSAAG